MKTLFDTNTLVAALVETHPHHPRAWPWLIKAKQKDVIGLMGTHSLAEIYSTLPKLPIHPKISPSLAERLILEDIIRIFRPLCLTKTIISRFCTFWQPTTSRAVRLMTL